ncbi:MAG: hypothetical protein ACI81P_000541 [Neolewinella sp.]|jgi:hypothetical protein
MAAPKNDWVQLQTDVQPFRDQLAEAAETVVDEGVSNYPIFFAYNGPDNEQAPGIAVTKIPTKRGIVWQVNLTTLEELVAKTVIPPEKIDPFREVYKKNHAELCFLIVDEEGARFGFVPK